MAVDLQAHEDTLQDAVEEFYAERSVPNAPAPVLQAPEEGERGTVGGYDWRAGEAVVHYRPTPMPALSALQGDVWDDGPVVDDFVDRRTDFIGVGVHEAWHAAFDDAHRVSGEKWRIYDEGAVERTIGRATRDYLDWVRGSCRGWLEIRQKQQPDATYDRLYQMTGDRIRTWFGDERAEQYERLSRLRGVDEYVARTVAAWYGSDADRPPQASWDARETFEYTLDHAAVHTVDGDALTGYIRDEGLQAVLDMETDTLLDRFTRPI